MRARHEREHINARVAITARTFSSTHPRARGDPPRTPSRSSVRSSRVESSRRGIDGARVRDASARCERRVKRACVRAGRARARVTPDATRARRRKCQMSDFVSLNECTHVTHLILLKISQYDNWGAPGRGRGTKALNSCESVGTTRRLALAGRPRTCRTSYPSRPTTPSAVDSSSGAPSWANSSSPVASSA